MLLIVREETKTGFINHYLSSRFSSLLLFFISSILFPSPSRYDHNPNNISPALRNLAFTVDADADAALPPW